LSDLGVRRELTIEDIVLLWTSPDEWRRSFLHRKVLLNLYQLLDGMVRLVELTFWSCFVSLVDSTDRKEDGATYPSLGYFRCHLDVGIK